MSVRRLVTLLLCLAAAPSAGAQVPAQWDLTVRPGTVTVGQPFLVRLHVRAGPGATITFPAGPDSAADVAPLDPRHVTPLHQPGAVEQTADYRLAAWNVGKLDLALPDLLVRDGGKTQRISLSDFTVFVRSVLPADSAQRKPKPARELFVGWAFPWWILFVLAVIALVAWLTRRQRRGDGPALSPAESPFEHAEREFNRVTALGLVEAGERGRHLTLMVEVLRDYLARRFALASLSLTSDELLAEIADADTVPHDRLAGLLREADLVKFARRPLTTERALALGNEARAIVAHEHVAATPPPSAEAA